MGKNKTFIGFDAVSVPTNSAAVPQTGAAIAASVTLPPTYTGDDSALGTACKMCTKKDPITKIKALGALRQRVSELHRAATESNGGGEGGSGSGGGRSLATPPRPLAPLRELLPHWAHLFVRLALDNHPRVRAAAALTLGDLVASPPAVRRALQPLMPALIGPWWCLAADPEAEVARAARGAWAAAFSAGGGGDGSPGAAGDGGETGRGAAVLESLISPLVAHLRGALISTASALNDVVARTSSSSSGGGSGGGGGAMAEEEGEERLERVTITALGSLARLLEVRRAHVTDRALRCLEVADVLKRARDREPGVSGVWETV